MTRTIYSLASAAKRELSASTAYFTSASAPTRRPRFSLDRPIDPSPGSLAKYSERASRFLLFNCLENCIPGALDFSPPPLPTFRPVSYITRTTLVGSEDTFRIKRHVNTLEDSSGELNILRSQIDTETTQFSYIQPALT